MQPLSSDEIRGIWRTVLLPIRSDEGIDYQRLSDEIDQMIGVGLDGLYTNGSAGEFHAQTGEEFDHVSQIATERCEKAGVPFQISVSALNSLYKGRGRPLMASGCRRV
jgi:dihydrodipicolinate synthase/N-acetylneuraminate lyase